MYTVAGHFEVRFHLSGMRGEYVECSFDQDGRGKFGTRAEAVIWGQNILMANPTIKTMQIVCVTPDDRVIPFRDLRYCDSGISSGVMAQNPPVYREEDERVVAEVERANIAARKASEAPV